MHVLWLQKLIHPVSKSHLKIKRGAVQLACFNSNAYLLHIIWLSYYASSKSSRELKKKAMN